MSSCFMTSVQPLPYRAEETHDTDTNVLSYVDGPSMQTGSTVGWLSGKDSRPENEPQPLLQASCKGIYRLNRRQRAGAPCESHERGHPSGRIRTSRSLSGDLADDVADIALPKWPGMRRPKR